MCSKRLLLRSLLLFLFVGLCFWPLAGQTTLKLEELQTAYQKNNENLNRLSVMSEIDLMQLQVQLPELQTEVNLLQTTVTRLIEESRLLGKDSAKLTKQLTELNSDIGKLSDSLDKIETLTMSLGDSLKEIKTKNNWALGISAGGILVSVMLFFYFVLTGTS